MKIKIEVIEDEKVAKNYMKVAGRTSFIYYVTPNGYNKNDRHQQEDLIKEINYQLRNQKIEELDVYSIKNELNKLEPGRSVWIEVKEK